MQTRAKLRIAITYDLRADYLALGYGEEETAEFDSQVTVDALVEALAALGYAPDPVGGVRRLCERLIAGERWDCVFNFCEGLKGVAREAQVPALLEAYDIPYVFSDPLTLAVALDKSMAKRVVRDCGIPTAPFEVIGCLEDASLVGLPFPLFLKPFAEGSGKGVDAHSKVDDTFGLERAARDLLKRFQQPVLVETYLPGREFTIGITGTGSSAEIFGIMEVMLTGNAEPHGYGYDNKENYLGRMDYRLADDAEALEAGQVALAAWRVLNCRDGGRVDIRSDSQRRPHFIEVNPLAGLHPVRSDLIWIANFKRITYLDLIGRIMAAFHLRHPALALPVRAG